MVNIVFKMLTIQINTSLERPRQHFQVNRTDWEDICRISGEIQTLCSKNVSCGTLLTCNIVCLRGKKYNSFHSIAILTFSCRQQAHMHPLKPRKTFLSRGEKKRFSSCARVSSIMKKIKHFRQVKTLSLTTSLTKILPLLPNLCRAVIC